MNYNEDNVKQKQDIVKKTQKKKKKIKKKRFRGLRIFSLILLLLCITLGSIAAIFVTNIIEAAPDVNTINITPEGFTTHLYDSKDKKIATLSQQDSNRIYVTIDKIPIHVQNAFIAIEDERFRLHNGIDLKGIGRATWITIKNKGALSEGASTITQQLIKQAVFKGGEEKTSNEKITRKLQEQYLAIQLEKIYNKDEILEYYLNTIDLYGGLGVETVSLRYFNKSVQKLTLSEAAVLAAIPKSPTKYNPIRNPEYNKERRQIVLNRMLAQTLITQAEYDTALADDVYARISDNAESVKKNSFNSYFVDEVIEQVIADLQDKLGYSHEQTQNALYRGGLQIYTTQDTKIQKICDKEYSNANNFPKDSKVSLDWALSIQSVDGKVTNYFQGHLLKYFQKTNKNYTLMFANKQAAEDAVAKYKKTILKDGDIVLGEKLETVIQPQSSFVIMEQSNGEVKAIVGGRGEKTGSLTLNRATNTTRQPGSCFKILAVFLPALDASGKSLATSYEDAPYNYPNGRPVKNWWGSKYRGYNTLRTAIEQSMNVITVKTLADVGVDLSYNYLEDLGFTTISKNDKNLATALGGLTNGVSNLEITAAFAAIANEGTYTQPIFYTKIIDHEGNVLIDNEPETRQVMKDSTAWLLTDAMRGVVTKGTGIATNLNNMYAVGKTGTTSKNYDYWFCGYTPYYTASIWLGGDINYTLPAGSWHKTLYKNIMQQVHTGLKNKTFPKPKSVHSGTICSVSGKIGIDGLCDHDPRGNKIATEYFATGKKSDAKCDVHISVEVCSETHKKPTQFCPTEQRVFVKSDSNSSAEDADYILPSDFDKDVCTKHTHPVESIDDPKKPTDTNNGKNNNNNTDEDIMIPPNIPGEEDDEDDEPLPPDDITPETPTQ